MSSGARLLPVFACTGLAWPLGGVEQQKEPVGCFCVRPHGSDVCGACSSSSMLRPGPSGGDGPSFLGLGLRPVFLFPVFTSILVALPSVCF